MVRVQGWMTHNHSNKTPSWLRLWHLMISCHLPMLSHTFSLVEAYSPMKAHVDVVEEVARKEFIFVSSFSAKWLRIASRSSPWRSSKAFSFSHIQAILFSLAYKSSFSHPSWGNARMKWNGKKSWHCTKVQIWRSPHFV